MRRCVRMLSTKINVFHETVHTPGSPSMLKTHCVFDIQRKMAPNAKETSDYCRSRCPRSRRKRPGPGHRPGPASHQMVNNQTHTRIFYG